jgi:hypothetical protein
MDGEFTFQRREGCMIIGVWFLFVGWGPAGYFLREDKYMKGRWYG